MASQNLPALPVGQQRIAVIPVGQQRIAVMPAGDVYPPQGAADPRWADSLVLEPGAAELVRIRHDAYETVAEAGPFRLVQYAPIGRVRQGV